MKKRSKLDLSGGADQDKTQAAGFGRATVADPATEPEYAERMEKSPVEPQVENVQEAAEQGIELRSSQASNLIKKHVIVAMGASLVPIPLFDLLALSGVQLKMLHSVAKLYEVPFSKNLGKSSIASLLGGVMPTSTAMTLASLAKAVPGLGTATGVITVSVLGGATTYAIGSVFVQHFESGGTLLDFDAKKMRAYFSCKLEEGKGVAANLKPGKA
ncbi:MAG: DUF697 domain-containing protein [Pseudomonadota bacterium]|nr:DUF697 domain-containing protein [Pseudomonadota bacterium]